MRTSGLLFAALSCHIGPVFVAESAADGKHHHGHHGKHHHNHVHHTHRRSGHYGAHHKRGRHFLAKSPPNVTAVKVVNMTTNKAGAFYLLNHTHLVVQSKGRSSANASEQHILATMRTLEKELAAKEAAAASSGVPHQGHLHMNGPLPPDFAERFAQAVARAVGCSTSSVSIVSTSPDANGVVVDFTGPVEIVHEVEDQAADPHSKLTNGPMRPFLVAGENTAAYAAAVAESPEEPPLPVGVNLVSTARKVHGAAEDEVVAEGSGIDVDMSMPYGELEPFGREDTAQELTEQAIGESDEMVDQLERAEVAEEKRAVFRALTRLRGAAITSFDGIARSQTGNIDEYNKVHKWRSTHPLHHLAAEESDVSRWAFPDTADF